LKIESIKTNTNPIVHVLTFFLSWRAGTIRTSQVLDRETSSHFWLTVYAQDQGPVPLFGRLEVIIFVDDVNDNVPQALEPAYYASVEEDSRLTQSIVQIQATDGDRNPEQAITFSITGGNPQGFFTIDPLTGQC
jgi:protocadherin Fat 1/2/3